MMYRLDRAEWSSWADNGDEVPDAADGPRATPPPDARRPREAYGRGPDGDHDDEGAQVVLASEPLREAVLPPEDLEDVGERPASRQRRAAESQAPAPEELREGAQAEPEDDEHAEEPCLGVVHVLRVI